MLFGSRMRISPLVLSLAVSVSLVGCTGDLVELNSSGAQPDMSMTAANEMGQGGGGEMGPSALKFFPDIQGDMDTKGCTLGACHGTAGNGTVMFVKMGATAQADIDMNYMDVVNEANLTAPDQSRILLMPLPGSGHGGGVQFQSTSDPLYIRWIGWITAGAPKQ